MAYRPEAPLIVQSDRSLLLETAGEGAEACRDALAPFCELLKSPEHVYTYRITPLSIWNAASTGMSADEMVAALERFSRFDLPKNVVRDVRELHGRFGRLRMTRPQDGSGLVVAADDPVLVEEVASNPLVRGLVERRPDGRLGVRDEHRGDVKQALVKMGWPLEDAAGYVEGAPLEVRVRATTTTGQPFALRDYQTAAVDAFWRGGSALGGNGVVVLPCGAGKTVVGIGAMARIGRRTLVLTTNVTAVSQWRRELLEKTELTEDDVGEYTGAHKDVRPVTIATYQILTHRKSKTDPFTHLELFRRGEWGLIVYDEVHLLPAPVFRVTAGIQATRRLGLTATLLREDGREEDVFSLIGPKRHDVPWKVLERRGFIAEATCTEIRVPMSSPLRKRYAVADRRGRFRLAAENPAKLHVVDDVLRRHRGEPTLVIGQYLQQIRRVAERIGAPLIEGVTPADTRRDLYDRFRAGTVPVLVVSKVGNFAVDLPAASVLVQVSGTFGSRQEEAQRLGRVLRPKEDGRGARFYTLVSLESVEETFAQHRQLFLAEQGYGYEITVAHVPLDEAEGDAQSSGASEVA
jgi:DNA excision repair protein ERCC-3